MILQGAERYKKLNKLGEGTYGNVFLAQDLAYKDTGSGFSKFMIDDEDDEESKESYAGGSTANSTSTSETETYIYESSTAGTFGSGIVNFNNKLVAIKKIKSNKYENDGLSWVALREIKILQEIHHDNVITLIDVFVTSNTVCLVLELCEHGDLEKVIHSPTLFRSEADIKSYMKMTLQAIDACHSHWVLHRDLKPANLLINSKGQIKLTDFGLARVITSPDRTMTSEVVTMPYRAPELLFGANLYGAGVDMWSIGCIFVELVTGLMFLAGDDIHLNQLGRIFAVFGTPNEQEWPGMKYLPNYVEFSSIPAGLYNMNFYKTTKTTALDLLLSFFKYDPNKRITAKEALAHPYFSESPTPTIPSKLPKPT